MTASQLHDSISHSANTKQINTKQRSSPDGERLMTLGTPGVTGDDESHFNMPSDVHVAPNGDIFVADGHGGDSNARIVKFDANNGPYRISSGGEGVAADTDGIIYSAEVGPRSVKRYVRFED